MHDPTYEDNKLTRILYLVKKENVGVRGAYERYKAGK